MCFCTPALAQKTDRISLSGTVVDIDTGEPIAYATVLIENSGLWGITDEKGGFRIKGLPPGPCVLRVDLLGYQSLTLKLQLRESLDGLKLKLHSATLYLDDIVVTAKEGGEITSSSRIEKQALEHVQPSSLRDVLQLLPGSVTENPNLNQVNRLSIREISTSNANAFGTAVVIDGVTLSNDANMQVRSNLSIGTTGNGESAAGSGIDARRISTDNIESIEVIRGIPSVAYGDLTSGAVVVKTRTGVSPWQIRLKATPAIKQVAVGKGFSLGKRRGVMNIDADYALSYNDIRTSAEAYRRFNVQMSYSRSFKDKLSFNTKIRANYSDANNGEDPDNFLENLSRDCDRGLSLNVNGRYNINKSWITNIEYLVSGDLTDQYLLEHTYHAGGRKPYSLSLQSGENEGFFSPFQYYSHLEVFGRPVNLQARLTANLYGKYGAIGNKVLLGAEWVSKGNRGKGKVFDPLFPPSTGSSNYRERSYRDIPFLHRYTAFLEDRIQIPLGGTRMEIQAGARFNGFVRDSRFSMSRYFSVEPRFNARYTLLNKSKGFRNLSVRAGWGVNYKMPSMIYLYPEPTYLDAVSFSYNDIDDNDYSLLVYTTKKLEEEMCNPQLKLQQSVNMETGIDFTIGKVSGSLVYYNENMSNGFAFTNQVIPVRYKRYGYEWVNGAPARTPVPSGKTPVYENGNVYLDGQALPVVKDTVFILYQQPNNTVAQEKWGIEYTLDFPEIKAIRTAVSVNGAYMHVDTREEAMKASLAGTFVNGRPFPYAGIYAGTGNKTHSGSLRQRLNANIRFITHVPAIGMVITLTAQTVFMDKTRYSCEINDRSLVYYYDSRGVRHSGAEALGNTEYVKRVNPLYIVDMNGRWIPFTEEMERDPQYAQLIGTTNNDAYYVGNSYPLYGILNLRLTKEIGRWATVSFYANNVFNFDQLVVEKISGTSYKKNLPIYFGAEVKFTF